MVCEGWYPLENKAHQQETPGWKPGWTPCSLGVGFAHHAGDLRYTFPCPPTSSQPVWGVYSLPRGTAAPVTQHTPVSGDLFQLLTNIWNMWWNPTKLRPELNFGQHSCTEATFVTAPPLYLTSAGCPLEWLSVSAQLCSLLRFSLLGLEEPYPP